MDDAPAVAANMPLVASPRKFRRFIRSDVSVAVLGLYMADSDCSQKTRF
ncbi:hypothetical protein [Rhizobium fabae]|uniref:Uncharacterized protein n=1 Tax=Rhizobium fabae TaxID=573179 RepID=A0A7W6FJ28_9HYPH|nr:hypothetical protein [Rhizobium fabae]MBB3914991.1 hypothetical protein [Rhizobium fabae]